MNDNIRLGLASVFRFQRDLYFIFAPFREARFLENRLQYKLTPVRPALCYRISGR